MTNAAPNQPTKLFRDEGKTSSVGCVSCGGPITLRGFGAVEKVVCPYCGSELKPEAGGALALLQQAQRQRRQSALPLHARAELDGAAWEILGIVWRECTVDMITYPWQEFLLFNPYLGFRWLIYSMSDGHWSIGQALDGAPRARGSFGHKSVEFQKTPYRHFQSVMATVSYVEGEFPWQVKAGDTAMAHEYVAPPISISIEEAHTEHGADVNFTRLHYIAAKQVWKAFRQPGSPPRQSGVGSIQPNPARKGSKVLWLSCVVLLLMWAGASFLYFNQRNESTVVNEGNIPLAPLSREVEVGSPGKKTTLSFTFSAQPLSNSWAYADVMLISQEREEAIGFGVEVDEWHGVSGGESWREGNQRRTVSIGGVEGGKYLLQITPQQQPPRGGTAAAPAGPSMTMDIRMRQDVVLVRYILLPFVIIFAFPLLNALRGAAFEGRRWQQSDYASKEE